MVCLRKLSPEQNLSTCILSLFISNCVGGKKPFFMCCHPLHPGISLMGRLDFLLVTFVMHRRFPSFWAALSQLVHTYVHFVGKLLLNITCGTHFAPLFIVFSWTSTPQSHQQSRSNQLIHENKWHSEPSWLLAEQAFVPGHGKRLHAPIALGHLNNSLRCVDMTVPVSCVCVAFLSVCTAEIRKCIIEEW